MIDLTDVVLNVLAFLLGALISGAVFVALVIITYHSKRKPKILGQPACKYYHAVDLQKGLCTHKYFKKKPPTLCGVTKPENCNRYKPRKETAQNA